LPVEWLQSGKYQPRKDMSQDALEELANSIRTQGVIQPIVVRPLGEQSFEIIAGERRWRASQLARLDVVPCIVKDVPDEAAVVIALIENIQREDLNAIEEAVALQRLLTEFELTHQQVAEAVGKSRTTVTNLLRLNQLNDDVKRLVEHGDLDMGHARALLTLSGQAQSDLAKLVAQKGLTVRDTEKLVKKALEPAKAKLEPVTDPQIGYLERQLAEKIGYQVQLQPGKRDSGKLVISYENLSDLDCILGYFGMSES
ncbi:MAG: ParB/RepB/Spo0J family partition protein, partial [Aeromonas sobria]